VSTAKKWATYEDVLAAPPDKVAEVVNGDLYTSPRPSMLHARAASVLGAELGPPFGRGRSGPGGWVILDQPELHLGRQILVPDLGGWRRERLPEIPDAPFMTVPPDWVCEVLSPSTQGLDRAEKLPVYGKHGVANAWLLDPIARLLEVYRVDGTSYRLIATHHGDEAVKAEPFEVFELELSLLWSR
jgi:Uma2 family endonuclease